MSTMTNDKPQAVDQGANGGYVYFFGESRAEGRGLGKKLLGGKGANLTEMAHLGIPVPPGFVINTRACNYYNEKSEFPAGLLDEVLKKLKDLEVSTECTFGDAKKPLLVSVRSGAAISMPGMMDTILNLGLNPETVRGMAELTGNERFAWDSYRRFIQMFGNVVLEMNSEDFESLLEQYKREAGVVQDTELDAVQLQNLSADYRALVKEKTGTDFPLDVSEQLKQAIEAVFRSWNNERAIIYRKMNHIPDDLGTAVTVQSMVFGNMGDDSGTGVAFTRNPSTGERVFFGEYLLNAQGEDVVAGIRTPHPISDLEKDMPEVYKKLMDIQSRLEKHFKDMQDIEFTIQQKKLYLLQTRNGKRTGVAALRAAVEMVDEGLIDSRTALLRMDAGTVPSLLAPVFDPLGKKKAIEEGRLAAKGLNAGPGAASATVIFTSGGAAEKAAAGEKVILVRKETSPEDIAGMQAAEGILTARGGMTSHAAVVARGMNKPCVVGCSAMRILKEKGVAEIKKADGSVIEIREGDQISIDGGTGEVIIGQIDTVPSEIDRVMNEEGGGSSMLADYFIRFMGWADEVRRLGVRTNADTPGDARNARKYGAEGIGLCRTEHMFFEGERIASMREMVIAETPAEREAALDKLLPYQRDDFIGLFREMEGMPVTIRLLDPPLHEFLPHNRAEDQALADKLGVPLERVKSRAKQLYELNPMLGHRGVRLGITYPEMTRMQSRAIFEAAAALNKEGMSVIPEVMVPLVGNVKELKLQKDIIEAVAQDVIKSTGAKLEYKIGTMIEVPRAAVLANRIAEEAEFFSFGTNDLTQMTLGFSRDDAHKFLGDYIDKGIYARSPFESLDQEGVGEVIRMAMERGRSVRADIKMGICGEHGGEPDSVEFCHRIGLDYVSCSPFRVPVARLAAAQAALRGDD